MTLHLGYIPASTVIYIPWHTFDSNGASITLTGLAVTDIEIYKNGSVTQRSSDAGYALLDTDGIDFDGITGIHGISIDLSDNTDAGFYSAGAFYWVVISAITVDTRTINFVLATFYIGPIAANATQILGTAISTPATAGILDVNVKNIDNDAASASGTVTFPNATLASTTNITAGTIATATNVTTVNGLAAGVITAASIAADAITDAKVASDVTIASVTGAVGSVTGAVGSVTGAVGSVTGNVGGNVNGNVVGSVASVTGNVGGNVVGSVASVTAGVTLAAAAVQAIWDALASALTTANSIGKLLVDNITGNAFTRLGAPAGASIAADIAAIEAQTDDIGVAGAGLTALGDTRLANLDATVSSRLATSGYTAPPTVGATADAVWDEAIAGHLGAGSTGLALNSAGSAGDPWSTALPGAYGAGSAGNILGNNLTGDAFVRLGAPAGASVSADIAAIEAQTDDIGAAGIGLTAITSKTDNLPSDPADQSLIIAATNAIVALIGTPAGASVSADIAVIESQTDDIGVAGAGLTAIDLPNQTMDITGNITGNLSGSVGSVTGAVGSVTGAVGSVTGNVGGNVTGSVGSVAGAVGSVTGNVGGNVVGTVASVVGNVGGNVTGSVGSVTASVTVGALAANVITAASLAADAANEIADALLDRADSVETGLTVRGVLRLMGAACAGIASGLATATAIYRNAVQDSKPRITATVDVDGNRSAITWDVS